MRTYALDELQAMPTITKGLTDDLKIETPDRRVWLSRVTVADGVPYPNQVTVESPNVHGEWVTVRTYRAR